jgi:hypothetical protein
MTNIKIYNHTALDDDILYPHLITLTKIINNDNSKRKHVNWRYVSTLIVDYNSLLKQMDHIENVKLRLYLLNLNKKEFINRITKSKLNVECKTYLSNHIITLYIVKIN